MTTNDIEAFDQMMSRDTALIRQEDELMEAALEYGRIQSAMMLLDLQLGVTRRATPEVALFIYQYAQKHQPDLTNYEPETILAAQQERNIKR